MSNLFSGPGLGLGLNRAGQSVKCLPLVDLTSPASQTVTPAGLQFDEWSIYIKYTNTGAPASTEKLWRMQLSGSNHAFLHRLSNGNMQLTVLSAGAAQSYIFAASDYLLDQGDSSIVVAAKANDLVVAINGIIMYIVDSVSMPVGTPTQLGVGQNHSGTQTLSDSIQAFQYFNKCLSDTEVKLLGRHKDFGVSATKDANRLVHFKLGQSNSVGTQATAPGTPSTFYTNFSDMELIEKNGLLDTSYQDPSSSDGTGGSLFSNFQQSGNFSSGGVEIDGILGAQSGKTVAVMHIDRGDTGLVEDTGNFRWLAWDLSTANEKVLRAPAYQATLMQMIGALHGVPHSRTWWQGESDASDATISQVQYRNALVDLLRVFDEYVRVPTIVVGLHDEPTAGRANWSAIQAAQTEINSYYGLASHVSAAGAATEADEIHLSQAGYVSVGGAIATQINAVT